MPSRYLFTVSVASITYNDSCSLSSQAVGNSIMHCSQILPTLPTTPDVIHVLCPPVSGFGSPHSLHQFRWSSSTVSSNASISSQKSKWIMIVFVSLSTSVTLQYPIHCVSRSKDFQHVQSRCATEFQSQHSKSRIKKIGRLLAKNNAKKNKVLKLTIGLEVLV